MLWPISTVPTDQPFLESLKRLSVEELLLPVLIQLAVIILAARLFAALFRKLGQPAVVGEIVAGLVLGPSILGHPALPAAVQQTWRAIFHPAVGSLDGELADVLVMHLFRVLSQLGLIFLLFLIGLEFDFSHLRLHGKSATGIAVVGVALPFLLGVGVAWAIWPRVESHPDSSQPVPLLGFTLFLGLTLAITAIPILGRMMLELGITRTRLGAITISAAAVDDALGWILLAAVAAIVRAEFQLGPTLLMTALTVGFVVVMIFLVRPALRWWVRRLRERQEELGLGSLAILLAVIFVCALATNLIGIFAIFGAFMTGAVLSDETEFRRQVAGKLRDLVTVFFLPIFFTYTGLRTNIGSLATPELWLIALVVLAAAVVGKLGGCSLAAWLGGFSPRESLCIGLMMNTRALMGLIAINQGYELRVIPPSVFCMLVIMALVTTLMTTPLLLRVMPGTELEPFIRESGFVAAEPAKSAVGKT